MDILKLIKSRRSIRKYSDKPVSKKDIGKILEAGRWAPSGMNNQPWRFVVVTEKEMIIKISESTKYKKTVAGAKLLACVFIDNNEGYNRDKDVQAIGACLQNMLLEIHSLGLGACWIGEILNQRGQVEELLDVPESFELMAVLTIGYPAEKGKSCRNKLAEIIYNGTK